ncbi:MAG: tetratricopeptide repeat protein [Acidobacteriota bacterium]
MMPFPRATPRRLSPQTALRSTILALGVALLAACSPTPPLLDVPATDASGFEAGVQEQLAEAYAKAEASGTVEERAARFGELGQVLHAYELRDAAEPSYRNARNLAPEDPAWPYLLGVVLQEKGDLDGAIESFGRVLVLEEGDLPARIRLGQVLIDANQLEDARVQLERAVELDPDSALAHFFLGQLALAGEDHAGAAQSLEQSLRLQPDASRIYHALGRAYRGLGDLDKASTAIARAGDREVRLTDPRFQSMKEREISAAGFVRRAARAQVAGALDAAVFEYRKAIEAAPGNAEARAGLGATLAELGQVDEAKLQLSEAIRLGGDSAWVRYNLAGAHRLANEPDRAVSEYRTALGQDPGHVESAIGLADVLQATGRGQEAVETLESALENGEKKAALHLRLAAFHSQRGDARRAEASRRAVLASDPSAAEVSALHQQISDEARRRGDLDGAISALDAAYRANPSDHSVLFSLANLFGAAGRLDESAGAYALVVKARPQAAEAWLGLATALSLSGRLDDAAARLNDGVTAIPGHPDLSLALAQLLVTHPQPEKRNPARALELIEAAEQVGLTLQLVELKALAFDAVGRHADAAAWQRRLIEELRKAQPQLIPAAEARLADFDRRAEGTGP